MEVLCARSGAAALHLLETKKIDAVVLDDSLPDMEKFNLTLTYRDGQLECRREPRPEMPDDLKHLIEVGPGELTADDVAPQFERRRGF